jgi:hypothetical protein
MLKRHNKQGASVWDRKLTAVLGFLFGVTLLLFCVWVITLFVTSSDVDDCLDKGGRYDYELGQCESDEDHPRP